MVELAQVQAGELLDLLQAVHQGVAVDEELPGGLGDVQVVLKELVDGEQGLLVQGIDRILLEHLGQEDLAQGGGQLINQASDAQLLIIDDALLGIEDLAHIDGGLGFLVGIGQLPQMLGHGADADDGLDTQLAAQVLLHGGGNALQLFGGGGGGDLLDNGDIRLIDAQDEILELVGEHTAQHIHGGHIAMAHLTDQKHSTGGVGGEMQLLGTDVDITGQDIVHDDILDEGAPVMLLLVEGLGIVQGDVCQLAEAPGSLIVAGAEHGVLKEIGIADDGLEGLLGKGDNGVTGRADLQRGVGPPLTQRCHIGAGNDTAFAVDDAENTVGDIL